MLTKQQLNEFQSLLENEKQDIEERYDINDHLGLIRSHAHDSVGELSSYDNHPGDEGTELYEREKDIALNEHYRFEYAGVVNALKAIENGTYGKCEECGKEIPLERLEALPTARYCIEHTPDQVVSHERPVEEGVLMPPFGKFDMDEQDETVAYDAEDSWQDVESFGTSETPSDFVHPVFDHYNDLSIDSYENVGYVEEYENFVGVDIEEKISRYILISSIKDMSRA